ncbi:MAG: nucleobase:cation symporter-2 family protein [Tissierellia bacterium]|nr:nucleobase:cation symporter-2 family protein [Tissierellia bacterium]
MARNRDNVSIAEALPLSFQHVVAMIVGCITVPIVVSGAAGLSESQRILMIQASLICAGIAILVQSFSIKGIIGSNLPVIVGSGFAFISTMTSIVNRLDISYLFGAQMIGALVGMGFALLYKKIKFLFAPVVKASVVMTIGISLYKTAMNYMAGGAGNADYGSMANWALAFFTLIITLVYSHWGKGVLRQASTLFGLLTGYIVSLILGVVSFDALNGQPLFQLVTPFTFGIKFSSSAIVPMAVVFIISAVQDIGQFEATAISVYDRDATDKELTGGIIGNNVGSFLGSIFGGPPNATAGQNVGLVSQTQVTDKKVFYLSSLIVIIIGLFPKLSAIFLTIPYPVLGGATVTVFSSISMTGTKMLAEDGLTKRNMAIAGLSITMGIGVLFLPDAFSGFPEAIANIISNEIVLTATLAIILNLVLPKETE